MRDGWVETNLLDVVEVLDRFRKPINATERESRQGSIPYYGANGQTGWIDDFLFDEELVLLGEDAIDFADPSARKAYLIDGPSWVNNHAHVLRAKLDKVESYFLAESLNKVDFSQYVSFGTRSKLTQASMNGIRIPLPPLSEQKRIVDLISSVDSYIEALQQQLESAKRSRNAVLHDLLTAGGEDWIEGKVGDISVLRYGYTESANWDPIGPKFLRITDIQDGQVDWDLVPYCKISDADLSLQQLKDGDLVFARTGATTGKSFLVTNPPDSVSASYLIRLRPDQSKVNPYYLSIFFQSENYWQQVMAGTSGSAQGGVNASKLSNLKIQVPPLSRQKMISDLIEEMDIHASKIRDSLNRSQKLRSSMLSDLLSGTHEISASYDKVIGAA